MAATDYFFRWAEALQLGEVKKENVVDFIKTNIIFTYGIPRCIVTDNGTPFNNKPISSLYENSVLNNINLQCTMHLPMVLLKLLTRHLVTY